MAVGSAAPRANLAVRADGRQRVHTVTHLGRHRGQVICTQAMVRMAVLQARTAGLRQDLGLRRGNVRRLVRLLLRPPRRLGVRDGVGFPRLRVGRMRNN